MRALTMLKRIVAVTGVTALAGGGVAATVANARPDVVERVGTAGFHLDSALDQMVAFPTNAIAVRGRVVGLDSARWNTVDGKAPAQRAPHHYVFTPVRIRVDTLLGGTGLAAGATFTTRRYDGTVEGVRYAPMEGRSSLRKGADVVLFLQAPQPLNDGRTDLIANAVYSVRGDRLTDEDGETAGTLAGLTALLAASPRW